MINITAPGNAPTSSIILPNPQFSDTISVPVEVRVKTMTNGQIYTYRAKNSGLGYKWSFQLTRNKALEFKAFAEEHSTDLWRVIGFGLNGLFVLKTNPLTIVTVGRGGTPITSENSEMEIEIATHIP